MDSLIEEIQRIVARVPLVYAALLDDQVVMVAHSGPEAIAADGRDLAHGALELRNRLLELTGSWDGGAEFRIGVDVGPVMMSSLADGSRSLWGGAITVAKVLAATGGRRAITVSETAYQILSGDFLFRQRGTYFLPETGTMRTFVLVGGL
jgi:class 3 adenylate cyclase